MKSDIFQTSSATVSTSTIFATSVAVIAEISSLLKTTAIVIFFLCSLVIYIFFFRVRFDCSNFTLMDTLFSVDFGTISKSTFPALSASIVCETY